MQATHTPKTQLAHSIMAFVAAAFWGLYWLPLRKIDEAGVTPGLVNILPTIFICIKAAQILSPGRVGILMMSEVLVAGISAPLIAGESISGQEWAAATLIILAGIIEVTAPGRLTGT